MPARWAKIESSVVGQIPTEPGVRPVGRVRVHDVDVEKDRRSQAVLLGLESTVQFRPKISCQLREPTIARPPDDWKGYIYLNPMDVGDSKGNHLNLEAVKNSVLQHRQYIMGVQMHKLIGLP